MSIFDRSKTVTVGIPKVHFVRNYKGEIDWERVASVAFSSLAFVIIAGITLSISFHLCRVLVKKPTPPPKVITRTVYESALTAAQKAYIKQCQNDQGSGYNTNGIPDVHTGTWTCTFPKGD